MNEKQITRWEPLRNFLSLRDNFDDLFENFFGRMPMERQDLWAPIVDIVENNGNIEVKVELPGMNKDNIKVTIKNNMLRLSGERKQEEETTEKTFHRSERYFGKFCRTIQLPADIDADKIKAQYKDGVLNLTLPKPESMKPKEIEIEVK
jgi:HSP20 family protein